MQVKVTSLDIGKENLKWLQHVVNEIMVAKLDLLAYHSWMIQCGIKSTKPNGVSIDRD